MSLGAVVFMLLTMGGVLGLNALCIGLWLRRRSQTRPPVSSPPAAPSAEPPAS